MSDTSKKEALKSVAVEMYNDMVKPAAKSAGNILAFPLRAIDVALSKPKLWLAKQEQNYEKTLVLLAHKMKNIPEDKIVAPENYIAVPALQQISYCFDSNELRDMYANLLAASMNTDTKWDVHPAYVDIIKQLTPDEAKLLKALSTNKTNYPIIDIIIRNTKESGYTRILEKYTDIAEGICDYPQKISAYLENLNRLEIITIENGVYMVDEPVYDKLKANQSVKSILAKQLPEGRKYDFEKYLFHLTEFGRNFKKICID